MKNVHMDAAELVLSAGRNGSVSTLHSDILATSEALRGCYGRAPIESVQLHTEVDSLCDRLLGAELRELIDEPATVTEQVLCSLRFRACTLIALLCSAGETLDAAQLKDLITLVRHMEPLPADRLAVLLAGFESLSIEAVEQQAARLLEHLGIKPSAELVSSYGHPVDTGIISALSNPLVKPILGTLVDTLADAYQSRMLTSAIPVTEKSFPELNALVDECVRRTGIRRPGVAVSGSLSGINACTFGSDSNPFIALSPLLVKQCSREQQLFIIGHECGHIAMGHVTYHTAGNLLRSFSAAIPVIGEAAYTVLALPLKAWSRCSEITADRAGLICCGDVEIAKRALVQCVATFMDANDIDMDEYLDWSRRYRSRRLLRRGSELTADHPMIPKRIEALELFAHSRRYYDAAGLKAPADALAATELDARVKALLRIL